MRNLLPEDVFHRIQDHLITESRRAQAGWLSAKDDEDTLTGDFFSQLRTQWMIDKIDGRSWSWRIDYKKFRGRGPGAAEKILGADGIIQLEFEDSSKRAILLRKGILFQAKKKGARDRKDLLRQCKQMQTIAGDDASMVVEYGPRTYRAFKTESVLSARGSLSKVTDNERYQVGDLLADQFLPCTVGSTKLYVNLKSEELIVPHERKAINLKYINTLQLLDIEIRTP